MNLETDSLYSTNPTTSTDDSAAGGASAAPPAALAIVKERRPVSDDDDEATAATVKMMCDYIAQGIQDPGCRRWAGQAAACYALGDTSPAMLYWAVFWLLKHAVKYQRDEPALFQMGHGNARDLLTAPAVLVRQPEPKEDCDGFTMLACALLGILSLKAYPVTVKADPDKPRRWSHVFALVDVGGRLCALDASHGAWPGWMIPREHIFAYQVWNLDGSRSRLQLPADSALHGYVRRGQGLGQVSCPVDPSTGDTIVCDPTTGSPGGAGINWTSLINNLVSSAAKVATVAEAPPGSIINPQTGALVSGGPGYPGGSVAQFTATTSSSLPWIVGGLMAFGLLAAAFSGKK